MTDKIIADSNYMRLLNTILRLPNTLLILPNYPACLPGYNYNTILLAVWLYIVITVMYSYAHTYSWDDRMWFLTCHEIVLHPHICYIDTIGHGLAPSHGNWESFMGKFCFSTSIIQHSYFIWLAELWYHGLVFIFLNNLRPRKM